jgi:hypothetical protein
MARPWRLERSCIGLMAEVFVLSRHQCSSEQHWTPVFRTRCPTGVSANVGTSVLPYSARHLHLSAAENLIIRVTRLLVTLVLVTAGAVLVAPSAMADPAEVNHVTEERFIADLCNGDLVSGDVKITNVFITLPTGDHKIELTAHGSATSDRGNKYVINQRIEFLIHTEGGVTNSILQNRLVLVSKGSAPNEFVTITANTATGVFTFDVRCVG